jgi:hypothetical protein
VDHVVVESDHVVVDAENRLENVRVLEVMENDVLEATEKKIESEKTEVQKDQFLAFVDAYEVASHYSNPGKPYPILLQSERDFLKTNLIGLALLDEKMECHERTKVRQVLAVELQKTVDRYRICFQMSREHP